MGKLCIIYYLHFLCESLKCSLFVLFYIYFVVHVVIEGLVVDWQCKMKPPSLNKDVHFTSNESLHLQCGSYCLTRRHMTLCDVKIHHGSLESGWTLLMFTFNQLWEGMHLNISNEFNFSDVHGSMNCSGSLAKFTCHFARDPLRFIPPLTSEI